MNSFDLVSTVWLSVSTKQIMQLEKKLVYYFTFFRGPKKFLNFLKN